MSDTYTQTVRAQMELLGDEEILARLRSGSFTEEARVVALSVLESRPPASPADPGAQSEPLPPRSAFLGVGLLAAVLGLSILFSPSDSLGFRVGSALGRLLGVLVLALPIFLVWRFFSATGRRKPLSTAFNVFAAICVCVWALAFLLAPLLLPELRVK